MPPIKPPRPMSSVTSVGIGAVESEPLPREREQVTPPSGTQQQSALRQADVSLILTEIHRIEEKVDATITDLRATRAAVNGVVLQVSDERGLQREARMRAMDRFDALDRTVAGLSEAVGSVSAAVLRIEAAVGQPPQRISLARASQQHELTAAELTALEQGSGLFGVVGRLVANDARSAMAAGEAAGTIAGQEAGRQVARRSGVVVGLVSTAGTVAAATADHWVPLVKALFGG